MQVYIRRYLHLFVDIYSRSRFIWCRGGAWPCFRQFNTVPSPALSPVAAATEVCETIAKKCPRATIVSGALEFRQKSMFNRLLHNEAPMLIQRRLQWLGVPMVVLPVRTWV